MINVLVDCREKGKDSDEGSRATRACDYYMMQKEIDNTNICQLEYGDYLFTDAEGMVVVFEYKTIDDLFNSLLNKSLFEEVYNQTQWVLDETDGYGQSFIVIEGDLQKYLDKTVVYTPMIALKNKADYYKYKGAIFNGAIRRLRTYAGVIRVRNEKQGIGEMFKQAQKSLNMKAYGGCKRSLCSNDIVDYTLSGCGGISNKLIENIREQMPEVHSLSDLLNCSVEDFKQVNLIGEKKARKIYEWVHRGE